MTTDGLVGGSLDLFVNGTLMRGLPLHANLRGADFLGERLTAPSYRLYSIGDDLHPGMFEVSAGGVSVAGELYRVPELVMRQVEEHEPPHLYRGRVRLDDGQEVGGILYPADLARAAGRDISDFGGWRAYLAW
jgi:gamma-glutamylcyclotransferase (GGCT)/AIG2-like uncharacterized protein YtfP